MEQIDVKMIKNFPETCDAELPNIIKKVEELSEIAVTLMSKLSYSLFFVCVCRI